MLHPHECNRYDDGVGLTELLVSLALLALISLLILQGVGTGRHLWRGVSARAETAEAIQSAQALLRERLEQIYPATRYDAQQPYPDFEGAPATLAFLAPPSDSLGHGALRRYLLRVDANGDLLLSSTSDLWGLYPEDNGIRPTGEVLLHGVRGLSFAYFDGGLGKGVWRTTWHQRSVLPGLIRLQVAFPQGDTRWWPTFMVHAATTIDSECINPNGSGHCGGRL